jgi:membrane-bound metal-dependent hydrolase YbcI (DUF457 family)
MMGHSHALSGATAWAATCALAPFVGIHPHWGAISAGLLSTAGAALLPDLDHPEATIAWTFGPPSRALAKFVHRVSGGHRHATHSLAFAAAVPFLVWAGDAALGRGFAFTLLSVLFAFGVRGLHLAPSLVMLTATALSGVVWFLLPDLSWLPWSVAAGILAHLAGDCLTKEGCPLLWPRPAHYMLPLVQRTGNRVETLLFAPLFTLGTIALLVFGR